MHKPSSIVRMVPLLGFYILFLKKWQDVWVLVVNLVAKYFCKKYIYLSEAFSCFHFALHIIRDESGLNFVF